MNLSAHLNLVTTVNEISVHICIRLCAMVTNKGIILDLMQIYLKNSETNYQEYACICILKTS
jgi:hypothetical protein